MKIFLYYLVCLSLSSSVLGEMRVWEDRKGNVIEAEFVCEITGKVILRDSKGKDYKLPISGLSNKDQEYIKTMLPPDIEVKFKKTQDRKNDSDIVEMRGEVSLKKTSRLPYDRELKATLLIIGEDSYEDEYIIMEKADYSFTFKTEKTHSFSGKKFQMHQYRYSGSDDGVEYKGYLVVIYDQDGKIIETKASSDEFKKNVTYLTALKLGARFPDDMDGKPSRESSSSRDYS